MGTGRGAARFGGNSNRIIVEKMSARVRIPADGGACSPAARTAVQVRAEAEVLDALLLGPLAVPAACAVFLLAQRLARHFIERDRLAHGLFPAPRRFFIQSAPNGVALLLAHIRPAQGPERRLAMRRHGASVGGDDLIAGDRVRNRGQHQMPVESPAPADPVPPVRNRGRRRA